MRERGIEEGGEGREGGEIEEEGNQEEMVSGIGMEIRIGCGEKKIGDGDYE
jgi:hypothetical protein